MDDAVAQIDRVTVLLTVTSHTAARSRRAVLFRGHTHGMKRLLVADLCGVACAYGVLWQFGALDNGRTH